MLACSARFWGGQAGKSVLLRSLDQENATAKVGVSPIGDPQGTGRRSCLFG